MDIVDIGVRSGMRLSFICGDGGWLLLVGVHTSLIFFIVNQSGTGGFISDECSRLNGDGSGGSRIIGGIGSGWIIRINKSVTIFLKPLLEH